MHTKKPQNNAGGHILRPNFESTAGETEYKAADQANREYAFLDVCNALGRMWALLNDADLITTQTTDQLAAVLTYEQEIDCLESLTVNAGAPVVQEQLNKCAGLWRTLYAGFASGEINRLCLSDGGEL